MSSLLTRLGLLVLALLLFTACHAPRAEARLGDLDAGFVGGGGSGMPPQESAPAGNIEGKSAGDVGGDPAAWATAPAERMLVYTGTIALEVARVDEAAAKFLQQVKEWQGYLTTQQGNVYTVRLPASRFEEAFAAARTWGRVVAEERNASDVTEEFLDLGIRLDNARKSRDRLLALLEKADKVEDILRIEEQLRRLTEEIERMEGRRKFLADQVAMATLTISFQAIAETGAQRRRRTMSRFDWVNQVGVENVLRNF
jgi:hypothetical protein